MKLISAIIWISFLFVLCGGARPPATASKLNIKIDGKDLSFNVKFAAVNYGNVISTSPGKPLVQTFSHSICLTNYETDRREMFKPLTAPEQIRVLIELTGEAGTKDDSPLKVGIYIPQAEIFNHVRALDVYTFANGEEVDTSFETMLSTRKTAGVVNITSVNNGSVSGEVNITDGDKSIKGTFTAKLPPAKK